MEVANRPKTTRIGGMALICWAVPTHIFAIESLGPDKKITDICWSSWSSKKHKIKYSAQIWVFALLPWKLKYYQLPVVKRVQILICRDLKYNIIWFGGVFCGLKVNENAWRSIAGHRYWITFLNAEFGAEPIYCRPEVSRYGGGAMASLPASGAFHWHHLTYASTLPGYCPQILEKLSAQSAIQEGCNKAWSWIMSQTYRHVSELSNKSRTAIPNRSYNAKS